MNLAIIDPLGLHEFVDRISSGFQSAAPVAVVGLLGILLLYGLVFRR